VKLITRVNNHSSGDEDLMKNSSGSKVANRQGEPIAGPGMPATLRASRLDREAGLFLRAVSPLVGRPMSREQVSKFRRSWRLLAATLGRRVPVASIVERRIDSSGDVILLRIYTPKGPTGLKPGFLWCHGGGFVVGDLDRLHLSQRGTRSSGRCGGCALSPRPRA
jgi:acetyl esterase